MKPLPGFREVYPADARRRRRLFESWRRTAERYGFVEYDGPVLEPVELYRKKSGGELAGQLFEFVDKSEREVTLRPEMTPTLARMVAEREREFRKPLRWFSIGRFFRYEKQQKGRLREFHQFNADIIGESGAGADAELAALGLDLLRDLGLGAEAVAIRISDRRLWSDFLETRGVAPEAVPGILQIVDKMEREPEASTDEKLAPHQLTAADLREGIVKAAEGFAPLQEIREELAQRGLGDFVEIDPLIVRGLAYYTGAVFEWFDRGRSLRALAGGGRYDTLVQTLSDGAVDLPAAGFGMGDVVLEELLQSRETSGDEEAPGNSLDFYVVLADETRRGEALGLLQQLRDHGFRSSASLATLKVGKQFQQAEQLGARQAVVVGGEWPALQVKTLATRATETVPDISQLIQQAAGSATSATYDS